MVSEGQPAERPEQQDDRLFGREVDRRTVLRTAGVVGAGAAGLAAVAACGAAPTPTKHSFTAGEVPVGGGAISARDHVVVTQPQQGTYKGFSAVCTHEGCLVTNVDGGTINCPCHGSKFSITDGSVQQGPAPKPLPALAVKVSGNRITVE
ncbi:MAG TPA: Rieske (2Fe-2S) protein [Segeticoccus sp.]|uniref:Rieske (2Fe-2S) protein n=1 Tax=Segeticoccus sp. TaxID=2706531 RepID=UPI002D80F44E|nr:Rieske (2Fe-2S) protein [Segeticoccus sp.]HET8599325.1 Rieske (2Fe-2S) protein [Segeticoccus sp.]